MTVNGEAIVGADPLFPYEYDNVFVTSSDEGQGAMYVMVPTSSVGDSDKPIVRESVVLRRESNGNSTLILPFVRPAMLTQPLASVTLLGVGDINYILNTSGLILNFPGVDQTAVLRTYYSAANQDMAPCATRSDSTCEVYTDDNYVLVRPECSCATTQQDPAMVKFDLLFSEENMDNTLGNPTTSMPTYGDVDVECYGFPFAVENQLRLDAYWNSNRTDMWVLADPASRAEAQAQGYVFNSTIGYCYPTVDPPTPSVQLNGLVFKLTF
jgi:hypothetical protein